tara:strand:+ start:908 stop:1561 length:654 start_codon:yes stop_codon:yes gene_type:complete
MSKSRKRKIKKLSSRLKYLNAYVDDISIIYEEYQVEWRKDYQSLIQEISGNKAGPSSKEDVTSSSSSDQASSEKEDKEVEPGPDVPPWAKKLYRKIALLTHPDRIKDEESKAAMTKLFSKAAASIKSGDFDDIIDVAINLGIEVELSDSEMEKRIEKSLESAEEKMYSMENCIAWAWCEAESIEAKIQIISQALSHEGISIPGDDELKVLVEKLDKV